MRRLERRVLLVEDNEDDAEFAVLALGDTSSPEHIDVVADGEAALHYLHGERARSRPLPALVLLDIKLPKIDGLEVLRRIRSDPRTRTLPTVVLTSSDLREDIERSYALGANSYVRKPVEFSQYEAILRRVGEYWLRVNEPNQPDPPQEP